MVPITYVDALIAFVFLFFSLAFFTLGMFGLGKGKPETAGTLFLVVGIITGIMGFIIINAHLDNPVKISVGLLVLMVACTFLVAGTVKIRGYDMVPLGNLCIVSGLMRTVTLVAYKKITPRTLGWTFVIQAFYTLFIPAALLLMGVFSLKP